MRVWQIDRGGGLNSRHGCRPFGATWDLREEFGRCGERSMMLGGEWRKGGDRRGPGEIEERGSALKTGKRGRGRKVKLTTYRSRSLRLSLFAHSFSPRRTDHSNETLSLLSISDVSSVVSGREMRFVRKSPDLLEEGKAGRVENDEVSCSLNSKRRMRRSTNEEVNLFLGVSVVLRVSNSSSSGGHLRGGGGKRRGELEFGTRRVENGEMADYKPGCLLAS